MEQLISPETDPKTQNAKTPKQPTLFEFIRQNYGVFQTLLKIGKIPISVALHYKIYLFYKTLNQSKMQAYLETAEEFNLSENTIQRAVKEMEERVLIVN